MATIRVKSANLLRRDTAENWKNKNPILRKGEQGLETDTGIMKIGDGTTEYNSLSDDNIYLPKSHIKKIEVDLTEYVKHTDIDQTYSPTSENAQSGKAVSEAVTTEEKRADNTFANALKGTKSGTVILLDDVSPVTHEMGVKVRGKNLLPYPFAYATFENHGVTFTDNKDGTITLNGKNNGTDTSNYYLFNSSGKLSFLKPNTNYYLSYNLDNIIRSLRTVRADGSYNYYSRGNINFPPDETPDRLFIQVKKTDTTTYNNTVVKLQIEEGTAPTAYTRYVPDLTAVKVSRCGKNLFDTINAVKLNGASNFSITNNAITVSQNSNYNYASANVLIPQSLIGKTVTISAKSNTSGANVAGLRVQWVSDLSGATGDMILGSPDSAGNIVVTVTVPTQPDETHNNLCLMFYSNSTGTLEKGTTYTATYSDIQIELGSTATYYEPYITPTDYTPKTDGTVEGITSLYPTTTLTTDTEGVLIDCEYNRDINKAFAALEAAIVANNS